MEYQIIFDRQNQLIDDLFGDECEVIISFGFYTDDTANDYHKELTDFGEFQKVWTIDLHKERPREYDSTTYFDIFFKVENWKRGHRNNILRAIADDEFRAMFISVPKKCIIAPYDGGADVIVESTEKRDSLKYRYRNWLSDREDGM